MSKLKYVGCDTLLLYDIYRPHERYNRVIKVKLNEILGQSGRSFYWLSKESGISYNTLWRLKNGKAKGINFDTLESLCRALKCAPGDILEITGMKK
jgi:putative transcriptional regulator